MAKKLGPQDVVGAPPLFPKIEHVGYPPLHAQLDRFGQTAALVQWIHRVTIEVDTGRRGGIVQAVSLYLTGLDRDADNCAIAAARGLRFTRGTKSLPMPAGAWEQVQSGPRPLAVQIFLRDLARLDPSIRAAFFGMGAAFFGTLGVEQEGAGEEK